MRAGPLSNPDVIELLNRHYVPVYLSGEDFAETGAAPQAEKDALRKVLAGGHAAKLSVGTVHAYVLDPAGNPIDSQHVAEAAAEDNLLGMLRRNVERLNVPAGEALATPAHQAACPVKPADGQMLVQVVSRREGTAPGNGGWDAYPGEDWVLLDPAAQAKLLPPAGTNVAEGAAWEVDRDVAASVLTYFYPQTENNDVAKNVLHEVALRATIVSVKGGVARARLDGRLRMTHPFYPGRDTPDEVAAAVVGTLDFDPAAGRVKSFRLATDGATYMNRRFDSAARSVP